ncbi:hypothetical protein BAE44_0010196 [Dichanthelium oligosanthes]|uniref:PGG domain-containing protein n=1 Tax=Dichanthelium oligosanthes TaxID=888268 RepID=A0A1E5VUL6_9POAL|nr:hypothetical protein BAE44_0010196 [Dichanthelium oligosanthes]
MSEAIAAAVEFGPEQMTLSTELLTALTAGDAARLMELLSSEGRPEAEGHVAIEVNGAFSGAASPPVGTSRLLGVTSNGNMALHLVASRGHAELAALVCERAPSLVATRNRGLDTPLHCAAKAGSRDVAACVLSQMRAAAVGGVEAAAAALRARNCLGTTALHEAVRLSRAAVVDLLMAEAPELASVTTDDGVSPLFLAAEIRSEQMVRLLLRPSADGTPSPVSFAGRHGRTALHAAATVNKDMAQEILNWEPVGPTLLTRVDSSGRTPLHLAILHGRLDVAQLFLDGHTSIDQARISCNHGLFPAHAAAMVGSTRILDELIKKCPDYYELVDDQGRNFLHCAVEHNQDMVVRHICQNDNFAMLLNATDYEGNTPLHLAVKYGFPRIVSMLLQKMTVEIGITNKDGLSVQDLADRAVAPTRWCYFLDPHFIVLNCLCWLGIGITLDRRHPPRLADPNPTEEEEASDDEEHDILRNGAIGSVLIATVAFSAAFTVPGGVVADDDHRSAGTAILARRLMPMAVRFMIAAFAFGFQLVLGDANRGLVVFVYMVSLAPLLFCFPDVWIPLRLLGLTKIMSVCFHCFALRLCNKPHPHTASKRPSIMAEALAVPVEFGPEEMTLSGELLKVLTAGDAARLEQLLSGEEGRPQANGHVAINVNGGVASASPGAVSPPRAGASCLLGVTSGGNTALHLVASRGHVEVTALVCEKAPSLVATRNRSLDTPLHCSTKAGHREVVACLLSAMRAGGEEAAAAALRARNCLGATALYEAVRHCHLGLVDLLMSEAPELSAITTEDGSSPLYLAASIQSPQMVKEIVRPSLDGTPSPASYSGPEGRTALHAATAASREISREMAQQILNWEPEGPALLSKVDSSGRTPLHLAIRYTDLDVIDLFLDVPTSDELARMPDNHGSFPLHIAAMVGSTAIIDKLVQKCPDYYEMVDAKGRNLLHCAVKRNQATVVRYICQNDTFSTLHLAAKYGFPRIVGLLLQTMTVRTDIANKDGLTSRAVAIHALPPTCLSRSIRLAFKEKTFSNKMEGTPLEEVEIARRRLSSSIQEVVSSPWRLKVYSLTLVVAMLVVAASSKDLLRSSSSASRAMVVAAVSSKDFLRFSSSASRGTGSSHSDRRRAMVACATSSDFAAWSCGATTAAFARSTLWRRESSCAAASTFAWANFYGPKLTCVARSARTWRSLTAAWSCRNSLRRKPDFPIDLSNSRCTRQTIRFWCSSESDVDEDLGAVESSAQNPDDVIVGAQKEGAGCTDGVSAS